MTEAVMPTAAQNDGAGEQPDFGDRDITEGQGVVDEDEDDLLLPLEDGRAYW